MFNLTIPRPCRPVGRRNRAKDTQYAEIWRISLFAETKNAGPVEFTVLQPVKILTRLKNKPKFGDSAPISRNLNKVQEILCLKSQKTYWHGSCYVYLGCAIHISRKMEKCGKSKVGACGGIVKRKKTAKNLVFVQ